MNSLTSGEYSAYVSLWTEPLNGGHVRSAVDWLPRDGCAPRLATTLTVTIRRAGPACTRPHHRRSGASGPGPALRAHPRGGAPRATPAARARSAGARSHRHVASAFRPTPVDDRTARLRPHPRPETVLALAPSIAGLVALLHFRSPRWLTPGDAPRRVSLSHPRIRPARAHAGPASPVGLLAGRVSHHLRREPTAPGDTPVRGDEATARRGSRAFARRGLVGNGRGGGWERTRRTGVQRPATSEV